MIRRHVLAAFLQAMVHRFMQARLVTFGTGVDARLHLGVGSMSHNGLLQVGKRSVLHISRERKTTLR